MIIVVRPDSSQQQLDHILERIEELGYRAHLSKGEKRTIIGVIGDENKLQAEPLAAIPGVEQVLPILKPFKLASREFGSQDSIVEVTAPAGIAAVTEAANPAGAADTELAATEAAMAPAESCTPSWARNFLIFSNARVTRRCAASSVTCNTLAISRAVLFSK